MVDDLGGDMIIGDVAVVGGDLVVMGAYYSEALEAVVCEQIARAAGYDALAAYLDEVAGQMIAGWSGPPESAGLLGGIKKAVSKAARATGRSFTRAAQTLVHGVRKLEPRAVANVMAIKAKALAGDVRKMAVLKTLQAVAKPALQPALKVIHSASPLVPYVQSVVSFVPGVGTGVSSALGAAQALADGRPITDAAVAAIRGAVPGGPAAQMAFDTAYGLARGRRIDTAVLSTVRARIPGELGKRAFDTAAAVALARTAQDRRRALQRVVQQAVPRLAPRVPVISLPPKRPI